MRGDLTDDLKLLNGSENVRLLSVLPRNQHGKMKGHWSKIMRPRHRKKKSGKRNSWNALLGWVVDNPSMDTLKNNTVRFLMIKARRGHP